MGVSLFSESLYGVPRRLEIGCGTHSKPILLELKDEPGSEAPGKSRAIREKPMHWSPAGLMWWRVSFLVLTL